MGMYNVCVKLACTTHCILLSVLFLNNFTLQDYPLESWKPKVQMPFYTPPGNTPRKVAIERCPVLLLSTVTVSKHTAYMIYSFT